MLLQDGIVRYELGKLECVLHVMKLHELEHVGSELVHYVQHVKCDAVQQLQGHGQHEQCVLDHALHEQHQVDHGLHELHYYHVLHELYVRDHGLHEQHQGDHVPC